MIKVKEIHLRFDQMKDDAQRFNHGAELEDALVKLQS